MSETRGNGIPVKVLSITTEQSETKTWKPWGGTCKTEIFRVYENPNEVYELPPPTKKGERKVLGGEEKIGAYLVFDEVGKVFEYISCAEAESLEIGAERLKIMKEFKENYLVIFPIELEGFIGERLTLYSEEKALGSFLWYMLDSKAAPSLFARYVHEAFMRRADLVVIYEMNELAKQYKCEMPWLNAKQMRDMICNFDVAGMLFCYVNFPIAETEEQALMFDKIRRGLIYLGVIENEEKRT